MTKKDFEKNINKTVEERFNEVNHFITISNLELIQAEKLEEYDRCIAIRDSIQNIIDFTAESLSPLLGHSKEKIAELLEENNKYIYSELKNGKDYSDRM